MVIFHGPATSRRGNVEIARLVVGWARLEEPGFDELTLDRDGFVTVRRGGRVVRTCWLRSCGIAWAMEESR